MAVLKDCASSGREPPRHIYMETPQRLMSAGMDQTVPEEYIPLLMEETRLGDDDIRSVHWQHDPDRLPIQGFKVIIIGAGFAGLCAVLHAAYDYTCQIVTSRLAEPMRQASADVTEVVVRSGHWIA